MYCRKNPPSKMIILFHLLDLHFEHLAIYLQLSQKHLYH